MNELAIHVASLLGRVLPSPTARPVMRTIAPDKSFPAGVGGTVIKRNEAYFEIRLNQMSLANNASWFSVYDPLVVIIAGFDFGDRRVEVPMVIGPGMIKKHLDGGAPLHGTVITDAKVTGPHPYRGGGVTLSVSLYRIERTNYMKSLLKVVERMSSVIGLAQLGAMASMGEILLDGVEGLLGGGGETSCIADYQFTLPELNLYPLQAGFSALLMPPLPVDADHLLVRKGRLYCADADGVEHAYAASDFVLLSISTTPRRENEQSFPPYRLKRQALQAIGEGEASLKRAKALLLSALQQLKSSDDFTAHEANLLFDEWIDEFEQEVRRYERTGPMPIHAARTAAPFLASDVNRAVERLGL